MGRDGRAPSATWAARRRRHGDLRRGLALWDLKAPRPRLPLVYAARRRSATAVPVYGSGGFTTYTDEQLTRPARRLGRPGHPARQDEDRHCTRPDRPAARAAAARRSGQTRSCSWTPTALTAKQAHRALARRSPRRRQLVRGAGLVGPPRRAAFVRDACRGMDIAAGEYGYDPWYFRRHAGGRGGGHPPGRRHPLPGDHRLAGERRRSADARPCRSRPTARRRSTPTGCAAPQACVTSSTSTTTPASSRCSSTARSSRWTAACAPTRPARMGLELKRQDAERWRIR